MSSRRTKTSAPKTPRRRRDRPQGATLGIEVDAGRVTAVLVTEGKVAGTFTGAGPTLPDRLNDVVKRAGNVDDIRIAVPLVGSASTPFAVTSDLRDRAQFEAIAHRLTGTHASVTHVAGLFDLSNLAAGQTAPGLALTAPRGPIDEIYATLNTPRARVASPAAHAGAIEGLSLALRDESAELTLTVNGRVTVTAHLPAGGLRAQDESLGQGNAVGTTRLGAALTSRADDLRRSDPEASAALSAYLRLVTTQVADTLTQWTLAGHTPPPTIYVHGRGGTAAHLTELLSEVRLRRTTTAGPEGELTLVEPARRAQLVSAYLAAVSARTAQPAAAFPNPAAVHVARTAHERAATRRTRRTITLAVAALIAVSAGPLVPAALGAFNAQAELTTAVQEYAARTGTAEADVREHLPGTTRANAADLDTATTALTALAGTEIVSMEATHQRVTVTAHTQDPASALTALAAAGLNTHQSHYTAATGELTVELTGTEDMQ